MTGRWFKQISSLLCGLPMVYLQPLSANSSVPLRQPYWTGPKMTFPSPSLAQPSPGPLVLPILLTLGVEADPTQKRSRTRAISPSLAVEFHRPAEIQCLPIFVSQHQGTHCNV